MMEITYTIDWMVVLNQLLYGFNFGMGMCFAVLTAWLLTLLLPKKKSAKPEGVRYD